MTWQTAEQNEHLAKDDAADAPPAPTACCRRPRVSTVILGLALLLMTAAYVAELRESSELRGELRRASAPSTQPTGMPATQAAAAD